MISQNQMQNIKKPFLHAFAAALYIVFIVFAISTIGSKIPQDKAILTPMVVLSLFVLSAAVMGYLFVSQPLMLYMENKKQEAMAFFGKTVIIFACFVALFVILLFIF
ncbi:hypothetical protein HY311_03795 [Candidatus Nomurabacteria bacterium]|nr:hypothetical protein [Candidatus Nomurabacteria bacterium]